jgi:hypothetical protein
MKPATYSTDTSPEEKSDFDLPEVSAESTRLMEDRPPPSFSEQMAHAQMLLAWRNGRPVDHPPRQDEPFVM